MHEATLGATASVKIGANDNFFAKLQRAIGDWFKSASLGN
jgi:hypothetical protein